MVKTNNHSNPIKSINKIIFNIPNCICYIRVILLFIGLYYGLIIPWLSVVIIEISGMLDMLDGTLARKFKQQTLLGQCLDMTVDRVTETLVLILLCLVFKHYWLLFAGLIAIDISSHFLIIFRGHIYNNQSHKMINNSSPLLKAYNQNRYLLMTFLIIFYSNCLLFLFLYFYYPYQWIFIAIFIFLPGALLKLWINIEQLIYSIIEIARYELNNKIK